MRREVAHAIEQHYKVAFTPKGGCPLKLIRIEH